MTTARPRFLGPDLIRGVAVFLMFLTNAPAILGGLLYDGDARFSPQTLPPLELFGWGIVMTLPAVGGIGLFAALMGFGMGRAMESSPRRTLRENRTVWLRFVVLGALGLVHITLFWWGDILSTYAVLGLFVILFAGLHPALTRAWALALFALPVIFALASAIALIGEIPAEVRALLQRSSVPSDLTRAAATAAYDHGSLIDVLRYRASEMLYFQGQFLPLALPQVLAAFLLGVTAHQRGWLRPGALDSERMRRRAWLIGATGVGLCLAYTVALVLIEDPLSPVLAFADAARLAGAPLFGIGIALGAMAWAEHRRSSPMQRRTADVGRMTTSLYLLQSVSLSLAVYALPIYGDLGRLGQLAVGAAYCVISLGIAPWWLRRHKRGPVEELLDRSAVALAGLADAPGRSSRPAGRPATTSAGER